jgi:hypothetical protein
MKYSFLKTVSLAAVAFALAQSVQATPITGTIGFTGRVVLDTDSASTATQVISWVNPTVNGTSGSFSSVATGTAATITQPWSFTTGSMPSFWSAGGFTFNLAYSSITSQGGNAGTTGYVNVSGIGSVSGNGYDATSIIWNFSTQDPRIASNPDSFTFSASNIAVPDGASTIALLGFALTGASMLRRKLAA